MKTLIEAKAIAKIYPSGGEDTVALKDINVNIKQGESVAIIGKSGSGKSTLMHILATLDTPSDGELLFAGRHAHALTPAQIDHVRNKRFGFVFQQFFLNAKNTVLENVILPLVIAGVPVAERNSRGLAMLESVGLSDKAQQLAGNLSGGQKQRACIARALVTKPLVIFADEPTGNLDTENGEIVTEILFKLHKQHNITLVIVTHDPDLAKLCDRAIEMKDGRITNGE
ncbi:MAG: ABC transporter ATP-binding protein [Patescibacteria group bacterium]